MVSHNDRKNLTFEQAEGVAALPRQLRPGEITASLRSKLWKIFFEKLDSRKTTGNYGHQLGFPWNQILIDYHVNHQNKMVDKFSSKLRSHVSELSDLFNAGSYADVYGFVQFVLRHTKCPRLCGL